MKLKLTLRNQLFLWFLPITLIPLLVAAFFLYLSTVNAHIDDTYFKLQSIANTKADQIDSFFQERKNDVIAIADYPAISDLLAKHNETSVYKASKIDAPNISQYFKQYIKSFSVYDIILASNFGQILYSTTNKFDDDSNLITGPYRIRESPLAHAFHKAVETKTSALSNINFFRPSQNLALFIAVPVLKNTQVVGVVIMQFNAETINALVSDYSALGASGEIGIATPILDEVIQVTSLRHQLDAAFNLRIKSKTNSLLVDSIKKTSGSGEYYDYREIKVFAAWKKLNQLNWGLRVKLDVDEAMHPINNTVRWFIIFSLLLILTLTTIISIISKKLSAPISALTRASTLLTKGYLPNQVTDFNKGHDELSELSRTFNTMASELHQSHQQLLDSNIVLELKVIQRTKELQIAKENAEKSMQQAELANDSKSRFLANMSHELRTPLTSIIGFTEILKRKKQLVQQEQHFIDIIHENGEYLLVLINDFLDIAKIEANQTGLKLSEFNLNTFIGSIVKIVSHDLEKNSLQFQLDLCQTLPENITADKPKLRQILMNLLSNAIKFTEVGCILLAIDFNSQTASKGLIYFTVKDTGQGICEEELKDIFHPFTQTESGIKSTIGTGLGLAISQHLVTLMQGDIKVESTLGEGSLFHFFIPVDYSNSKLEVAIKAPDHTMVAPYLPKLKVLIVDDIEDIRLLFEEHFKVRGVTVFSASNGEEGIQQFLSHKPDLILMDFLMPVMDGKTAVQKIRLLPGGDQVTIFMVTASVLDDKHTECLKWGCDDILFKPMRINDILLLIEKTMNIKFIQPNMALNSEEEAEKITVNTLPILEPLTLPDDLLSNFHHAAIEGDVTQLNELLSELSDEYYEIRDQLANLIDQYDFDLVIKMTNNKQ